MAGYLLLTAPVTWSALHAARDVADSGPADLANGRGAVLCRELRHLPRLGVADRRQTLLGGGRALTSGFGTFYMPNISPDQSDGIGGWTTPQFVRAMREGVSPHGENEYPAFPYTSMQHMTANDLRDLLAFIKTLPAVAGKARDHDLKFPFTMRRGVGLWKLAFLKSEPFAEDPQHSAAWNRGRYLVEGPAHCAECHSPRNIAGAIKAGMRFSGAPDPEGHGYVPNITQDETGIGYWSAREIDDYLSTGVTPINTQAGESMAAVVANLAHLSAGDRAGMAEYIKSQAAIDAPNAGAPPLNRTAVIRMLPAASGATTSPTSALSAPADALAQASTLYTVANKPFFLDRAARQPDRRRRRPAAAGRQARRGGARRRLAAGADRWLATGWIARRVLRLEGAADPGGGAWPGGGRESRAPTRRYEDAATKLTWFQGNVTVWIGKESLNPDIAKIWDYSANLYTASCGACHAPHPTDGYLANQWIGSLKAMQRFTALDDGQYRLLQAYLQFHSKDVDPNDVDAKNIVAPAGGKS